MCDAQRSVGSFTDDEAVLLTRGIGEEIEWDWNQEDPTPAGMSRLLAFRAVQREMHMLLERKKGE